MVDTQLLILKKKYQQVGKKLKEIRESLGYSQRKFALSLGISSSALSSMEDGSSGMSINTLQALQRVHGVNLDELLNTGQAILVTGSGNKVLRFESGEASPMHFLEEPQQDYAKMDKSAIYQELILERQINSGLKQQIAVMNDQISVMRDQITGLQDHINTLRRLVDKLEAK